jgi:3-phenylpropionate/cinnamic acid dioxygenase small subunit
MLGVEDRLAIYELMALHGHLMDDGAFDRLGELFTDDFVYDLAPLGYDQLRGAQALVRSALALGDANPLAHHVTNALIVAGDATEATVRSKGLAVRADGTSGTVVYEDLVRKTSAGWRIARRSVIPRNRPLHGHGG